MIVPTYWAEGRTRTRIDGRQVTVRRFGWSDASEAEAQAHAESRAREALDRIAAGEKLARREPRIPYNGAAGVPIREEIVGRHGATVITRNAYGARCLNTPDVLFADIDFDDAPSVRLTLGTFAALLLAAAALGWATHSGWVGVVAAVLALLAGSALAGALSRLRARLGGDAERRAMLRIERFVAAHPDWHLRLYRTPAGLRVLALHRTFDPRAPEVAACFAALGADPLYARMCWNQRCFRARVSPKPWRIGIGAHLRPRPGVWPVNAARLPERARWIDAYERSAGGYAACRFLLAAGSANVDPAAAAVQALHDDLCRAGAALPLA